MQAETVVPNAHSPLKSHCILPLPALDLSIPVTFQRLQCEGAAPDRGDTWDTQSVIPIAYPFGLLLVLSHVQGRFSSLSWTLQALAIFHRTLESHSVACIQRNITTLVHSLQGTSKGSVARNHSFRDGTSYISWNQATSGQVNAHNLNFCEGSNDGGEQTLLNNTAHRKLSRGHEEHCARRQTGYDMIYTEQLQEGQLGRSGWPCHRRERILGTWWQEMNQGEKAGWGCKKTASKPHPFYRVAQQWPVPQVEWLDLLREGQVSTSHEASLGSMEKMAAMAPRLIGTAPDVWGDRHAFSPKSKFSV